MSGLFSKGLGFFSNGGSSGGSGGAGNFTSIATNTPSVAGNEVLETWGITGDAFSNLTLKNAAGIPSAFAAWLSAVAIGSANSALTVFGDGQTDTGGASIFRFNALSTGATVTIRPLFDFQNNSQSRFKIAANGAATLTGILTAGGYTAQGPFSTLFNSQAIPTVSPGLAITTNHSNGGSEVNFWNANGGVSPGFDWFNLTSSGTVAQRLMYLNGLGVLNLLVGGLTLQGPATLKSYTVATLPATPAAGQITYASDAGGNGPCIAIGNGSVWKRCDNTATTVV